MKLYRVEAVVTCRNLGEQRHRHTVTLREFDPDEGSDPWGESLSIAVTGELPDHYGLGMLFELVPRPPEPATLKAVGAPS